MQRQSVRLRGIGMELTRHRRAAGLTLEQVGARLGMSVSTLSRLENGRRETTSEEVSAVLAILGVTGADRDDLLDHVRGGSRSGVVICSPGSRGSTYQTFESEASMITNFELMLVPGIAQTAEYARAVISTFRVNAVDSDVAASVAQRMTRKAILTRKRPPRLDLIVTELALRQPFGGPEVMASQVRSLIDLAQQAHVSLRVIPAAVPTHVGFGGSFVIFDFADYPSFVFVELMSGGLYRDDPEDVSAYRGHVEELHAVALDKAGSVELMRSISCDLDGGR